MLVVKPARCELFQLVISLKKNFPKQQTAAVSFASKVFEVGSRLDRSERVCRIVFICSAKNLLHISM